MSDDRAEWQVAVFCQNERARIGACLASIAAAAGSHRVSITVIVNGSTDGSAGAAQAAGATLGTPVRVFAIPHGDKANAINQFLHDPELRDEADLYFFIDGYVTVAAEALSALAAALADHPDTIAASGIPDNGRTFHAHSKIQVSGNLRGGFNALRPHFVQRMARAGLRLPVGLYRGDGLLGSMVAHDLDAIGQPWRDSRLIAVDGASFSIESLSLFRLRDLRRQFRRKIRQMRGVLENEAIRQAIYTGGYAALPRFADDLIGDFLADNPVPAVPLADRPFMALALQQHRGATRPAPDSLRPRQVA